MVHKDEQLTSTKSALERFTNAVSTMNLIINRSLTYGLNKNLYRQPKTPCPSWRSGSAGQWKERCRRWRRNWRYVPAEWLIVLTINCLCCGSLGYIYYVLFTVSYSYVVSRDKHWRCPKSITHWLFSGLSIIVYNEKKVTCLRTFYVNPYFHFLDCLILLKFI